MQSVLPLARRALVLLALWIPSASAAPRDLTDAIPIAASVPVLQTFARETLSPVPTRRFLALDPVWGQFARTDGLTQVSLAASGAESGGQAPAAPGSLSGLIDLALREGVRAVFVPPGADARLAAELAQAIGGRSARLDPLAADYFETLRRAAALVADAELR